jgi:hypothetical protein
MIKSIFTKKNIIISSIVLILGVGIAYIVLKPDTTPKLTPIDEGLNPIRIIQIKDGKEQEINFTESGADIIASALISANPFDEQVKQDVQNLGIDRIDLPPLPEDQIKVIPNPENPQAAIEKYLKEVYTIFKDNTIQPNINQLSEEALDGKTQNIQSLLRTNADLYRSLFTIEVPQDALKLHKGYIRIAQIQNSFLLGLLNASSDPLRLDINSKITVTLLQKIDIPIKEELQSIRKKYNIIYQKQS